ncbi:hypothetical protein [Staphylococcus aureus]|nr:hypothetical protein [Staphylococcus aureus]CFM47315.1 site-specific recombinase [Staphylococcus aureus]CPO58415.1 site-specific recombinase [Staphylococcus aureus]CRE88850.1 site-specific recombinase [Staphylococcus aureus]
MQQLKTKRVGIYVRVSTEMQSTEGYSIDGQIGNDNLIMYTFDCLNMYNF